MRVGEVLRGTGRSWSGRIGLAIALLVLALATVGPLLYPVDPYKMAVRERLRPPSAAHPFGTDEFGRDLLARVIHGSRLTLSVAVISVGIAGVVGTGLGLAAGLGGRHVDLAVGAVVDVMLAFPGFLLALAIVAVLGPSLENAMIAIGIRRIPVFVRVVRAGVQQVASTEFVVAARALGAGVARVAGVHVLRNVAPTLVVLTTLQFPEAILVAAGLSFLGLGAQPPLPEWGALLATARVYIARAPWLVNFPGLAILLTVLGLNLLGNALRDVLDPRLSRSA
ncbi:MAG TPA: ABC transporter permease [Thermodesulfobacteriota bacterium]